MIIAASIIGYFLIGIWLAGVFHNKVLDVSVQKQLNELTAQFERHPQLYSNYRHMTEKQKIEKALQRAKDYDSVDMQSIAIIAFFFWPCVSIVFGIRYLFQKTKSMRFVSPSKFEKRLQELNEIDALKAQAIEDKKKYEAALKLLKAEGVKTGE